MRVPSRRGDPAFFARVQTQLRECRAVQVVQVNASTASVLLMHAKDLALDDALDYAESRGLFRRASEGEARLRHSVREGMRRLEGGVSELSGGELDLNGAAFMALAGCAFYQLIRGEVLAPAATLLWYAAGTMSNGGIR